MALKSTLLILPALVISGLMICGSSASGQARAKQSAEAKRPAAVKTAPGVVVRTTLPSNLKFNSFGVITPALTEDMSISKLGQTSLLPRTGAQKPQSFTSGFTFTPSGRVTDDKAFTLGVSSRVQGVSDASNGANISSNAPANYNVGFALGYRGFALEGGYNRVARATLPLAQGVDLGLAYHGEDWRTSLKVSQEAIERDPYGFASLFSPERRKAVELGGAYMIGRGIALTGGLRYQLAYPMDGKRDARAEINAGAVFLGTAVDF